MFENDYNKTLYKQYNMSKFKNEWQNTGNHK
jgi:hypothetical protein